MPTPLRFSVSQEAAEYMRSVMRTPEAGLELALITVLRQAEVVDGREQVWFDGEHFMICFHDVGRRRGAEQIELLGHRVSIMPSTLDSLFFALLTPQNVKKIAKFDAV